MTSVMAVLLENQPKVQASAIGRRRPLGWSGWPTARAQGQLRARARCDRDALT